MKRSLFCFGGGWRVARVRIESGSPVVGEVKRGKPEQWQRWSLRSRCRRPEVRIPGKWRWDSGSLSPGGSSSRPEWTTVFWPFSGESISSRGSSALRGPRRLGADTGRLFGRRRHSPWAGRSPRIGERPPFLGLRSCGWGRFVGLGCVLGPEIKCYVGQIILSWVAIQKEIGK